MSDRGAPGNPPPPERDRNTYIFLTCGVWIPNAGHISGKRAGSERSPYRSKSPISFLIVKLSILV